jgi:hypothetical protein
VRLSTVATIQGAAAFAEFGVDKLEIEGAAVASQVLLYGIHFDKTGGVANLYVDLGSNCPTDTGFEC